MLTLIAAGLLALSSDSTRAFPAVCQGGPLGKAMEMHLSRTRKEPRPKEADQFEVTVAGPPDRVLPRVAGLLGQCAIPVRSAQGGAIEAPFPAEEGMRGRYDLTVRGFVRPAGSPDSSVVLLYAEEQRTPSTGGAPLPVQRVTGKGMGRARGTWEILRLVAEELRAAP